MRGGLRLEATLDGWQVVTAEHPASLARDTYFEITVSVTGATRGNLGAIWERFYKYLKWYMGHRITVDVGITGCWCMNPRAALVPHMSFRGTLFSRFTRSFFALRKDLFLRFALNDASIISGDQMLVQVYAMTQNIFRLLWCMRYRLARQEGNSVLPDRAIHYSKYCTVYILRRFGTFY